MTSTTTSTIALRDPVSLGRPTGRDDGRGGGAAPTRCVQSSTAGAPRETEASSADQRTPRGRPTTGRGRRPDACGPPSDHGAASAGLAGARRRWSTAVAQGSDTGMATAEYAIAMIAAVGFASLLVTVLSSATVRGLLTGLVTSALSIG